MFSVCGDLCVAAPRTNTTGNPILYFFCRFDCFGRLGGSGWLRFSVFVVIWVCRRQRQTPPGTCMCVWKYACPYVCACGSVRAHAHVRARHMCAVRYGTVRYGTVRTYLALATSTIHNQ